MKLARARRELSKTYSQKNIFSRILSTFTNRFIYPFLHCKTGERLAELRIFYNSEKSWHLTSTGHVYCVQFNLSVNYYILSTYYYTCSSCSVQKSLFCHKIGFIRNCFEFSKVAPPSPFCTRNYYTKFTWGEPGIYRYILIYGTQKLLLFVIFPSPYQIPAYSLHTAHTPSTLPTNTHIPPATS